ncbi:MAG TPA: FAD/NAD(P)-binding oxidoreductase [Anaeromyxobacteraceae bacterium]|nr:FAD/NAD(P)-binding oxidoreductase [Anaeromyxobacteraceae bacterium]
MKSFTYLIIGGGMAGHAAAQGIRELDPDGSLAILGDDPSPPYARPPLSKGLWTGKPPESVFLPPVSGLELMTGRRAVALDLAAHLVRDARGEAYQYEKLLLATGGRPRQLATGEGRVVYLRTLADFHHLAAAGPEVVVLGAGFIGSEIASSLRQTGRAVTLIMRERSIGERSYPAALSRFVTDYFAEKGVRLLAQQEVESIEEEHGRTVVRTAAGEEVHADAVVAGFGIDPDTDLARKAGIAVGDGIEVDEQLRTSAAGVWAAGDVASFPCRALGGRVRIEHEDNALTMGRAAGRSMAGANAVYDHLPFFYSDLFDLGYEAVGRLDARADIVESWSELGRQGVCYYLFDGRVKGVLLWGTFGMVDAARELIRREGPVRREELALALAPR